MDSTDIGQLIRHAREAAGMTLEEMADKVGMTAGALSHIERGRRLPTPANAVRIAQVLGLLNDDVLEALDQAHRQRRMNSLPDEAAGIRAARPRASGVSSGTPIAYARYDISELIGEPVAAAPSMSRPAPSPSMARSNRDTARWSEDTSVRIEALDQLADTAADAIRTLRGALGDENEKVRREARRLLRELDVRLPEE